MFWSKLKVSTLAGILALLMVMTSCTETADKNEDGGPSNTEAAQPEVGLRPMDLNALASVPYRESAAFGLSNADATHRADSFAQTFMNLGFPIRALGGEVVNASPGVTEVPEWQIAFLSGSFPQNPQLSWTDAAELVAETLEVSDMNWEQELKLALGNTPFHQFYPTERPDLSKEEWKQHTAWLTAFRNLGMTPGYDDSGRNGGYEFMHDTLSLSQMYVLFKALSTELFRLAGTSSSGGNATNGAAFKSVVLAEKAPCTFTSSEEKIVGGAEKFTKTLRKAVLKYAEKMGAISARVRPLLKSANLLSHLAETGLLFGIMRAQIDIDKKPLVRTKNAAPGEEARVSATVSYEPGDAAAFNCLRLALSTAGMSGINVPQGPVKNTPAHAVANFGFNELCFPVVAFRGNPNPTKLRTDGDGKLFVNVIGRAQKRTLTGTINYTQPKAHMSFAVAAEDNEFLNDVQRVAAAALSGPATAVVSVLRKFKLVSFNFSFKVNDPYEKTEGGAAGGMGDPNC